MEPKHGLIKGLHCIYKSVARQGFYLFGLDLYVPVNNYGHAGMVSSPYHTFSLGKLEAVNQYFVHIHSLVTDNNPSWFSRRGGGQYK